MALRRVARGQQATSPACIRPAAVSPFMQRRESTRRDFRAATLQVRSGHSPSSGSKSPAYAPNVASRCDAGCICWCASLSTRASKLSYHQFPRMYHHAQLSRSTGTAYANTTQWAACSCCPARHLAAAFCNAGSGSAAGRSRAGTNSSSAAGSSARTLIAWGIYRECWAYKQLLCHQWHSQPSLRSKRVLH